jgi:lipopolysaccharide transport system ATP-binding protein
MSPVVIRVSGLSKAYRIGLRQEREETLAASIKQMILRPLINFRNIKNLSRFEKGDHPSVVWALRDINFEIKAGDVTGIIGKNGSGKSTLLKLLSRITDPTEGRIEMAGSIASLLEVGTGFNPELTGRENVFLNGTLLGMTRLDILKQFDEIIEFSGVEKFIDTPVKRYSSGMKVRLAFAVAAHLQPDILIVDEVLAVGDAAFQKKCIGKMQQVADQQGRTVLFVSHDMVAVQRLCQRTLLLQEGNLVADGVPNEMIKKYLSQQLAGTDKDKDLSMRKRVRGDGRFTVIAAGLVDEKLNDLQYVCSGMNMAVSVAFQMHEKGPHPVVILLFKNYMHDIVFSCISRTSYEGVLPLVEKGHIYCNIPRLPLSKGTYSIDIICKYDTVVTDHIEAAVEFEVEKGDFYQTGKVEDNPDGSMYVYHQWMVE